MVFRDLLFVSNTSFGSKINEMREFLNKNYLWCFLYGFWFTSQKYTFNPNFLHLDVQKVFGRAHSPYLLILPTYPIYHKLLLFLALVRLTSRVTSRASWLRGPQGALLNLLPQDQGDSTCFVSSSEGGPIYKTV